MREGPGPSSSAPVLRIEADGDAADTWIVALLHEVAAEQGWSVAGTDGLTESADAIVVVHRYGGTERPTEGPVLAIAVEDGTSRSPAVAASAPDQPIRHELIVGAFKARRSLQVTRAAVEQFLERVAQARPTPEAGVAADRADTAAGSVAAADQAEARRDGQALLEAVDAWLARTTMTPEAAQAIGADRAILAAALTAPVIDRVIVDRVSRRLAAVLGHA